MKIKKMTGLTKYEKEYEECYSLWKECFGDSEQYMEYYFYEKVKDNTIYMLEIEGHVVSMLHLNPYDMMVEGQIVTCYYIVGVATSPNHRKKGYMAQLIKAMLEELYEAGHAFTYLMPVAEAIYTPYDFRYIYKQERGTHSLQQSLAFADFPLLQAAELGHSTSVLTWKELTDNEKEEAIAFANTMLEERFTIYPYRTLAYYERLALEMVAADGELLVVKQDDMVCAIVSYMSEVKNNELDVVMVETMIFPEDTEWILREVYARLSEDAKVHFNELEFLVKTEMNKVASFVSEPDKPIIMARAVDCKRLLETLRAEEPTMQVVTIQDSLIEQNNRTYEVKYDASSCVVTELPNGVNQEAQMIPVANLVEWVFANKKVYINDIV